MKPLKIQKHWIFAGIAVVVIAIVVFLVTTKTEAPQATPRATATPAPPPAPVSADWGTMNDLVRGFGTPTKTSANPDRTEEFKSKSVKYPHTVKYQQNVPVFTKEIITEEDDKSVQSIKQKFGNSEVILYGPRSEIGIFLYAYPTKGIAYEASSSGDVLFEIWYFAPTTLENFKGTWAQNFSDTPEESVF